MRPDVFDVITLNEAIVIGTYSDREEAITISRMHPGSSVYRRSHGTPSTKNTRVWSTGITTQVEPAEPEVICVRAGHEPQIAVWNGASWTTYTDRYTGSPLAEPPIQRAATVARLRALADIIEGAEQ